MTTGLGDSTVGARVTQPEKKRWGWDRTQHAPKKRAYCSSSLLRAELEVPDLWGSGRHLGWT